MNEQSAKSKGKRGMPNRIQLSLLLGVTLTILLGFLSNLFPLHIAKFLFFPALLFVNVPRDGDIEATFFYPFAIPLAILGYSLIIYVYLTIKGLPHQQDDRAE